MRARGFFVLAFLLSCAAPAFAGTLKCPPDSVRVGNACIDKYEASVWQIDLANKALVKKVLAGKATLADLRGGGATQLGCDHLYEGFSQYPATFPEDGNWTPVPGSSPPSPGVYAASVPGVLPTTCTTWFQAVQACAVVGKRLIRNEEWQRAAAETPDPGTDDGSTDCNISTTGGPVKTGSRAKCRSNWGVFDMVGNAAEWVADWADTPNRSGGFPCALWTGYLPGDDVSCFGGPGGVGGVSMPGSQDPTLAFPSALARGGSWSFGTWAGVFAVDSGLPKNAVNEWGFRCAR